MKTAPVQTGAVRWSRRLRISALALVAALGLTACEGSREPDASQKLTMKPSTTYLHLLRHTPFFTALATDQLQWVIDHSREWSADPGAVVAKCGATVSDDAYWVLLDGGWQVQHAGRAFKSGHADPGKWFSTTEAHGEPCELVTTEQSYVMRIERSEMQSMLAKGFGFGAHLDSGVAYYRSIFGDGAASAASAAK